MAGKSGDEESKGGGKSEPEDAESSPEGVGNESGFASPGGLDESGRRSTIKPKEKIIKKKKGKKKAKKK